MVAEPSPERPDRPVRAYSPEERRALAEAYLSGAPAACPSCGGRLDESGVPPNPAVSYVRRRVLLTCAGCGAHGVVDRSEDE